MAFVAGDISVKVSDIDLTDSLSYTIPSVTLSADKLYLLAIVGDDKGNVSPINAIPDGITTTGVIWDVVTSRTRNLFATTLYRATVSTETIGTIDVVFPEIQNRCAYTLLEITNIDSTLNGANAIINFDTTGWTALSGSLTLPAITTGNFALLFAGAELARNYTAGTKETALTSTSSKYIFSQYNLADDNLLDLGTPSGGNYAVIGVEIGFNAATDVTLDLDSLAFTIDATAISFVSSKNSEVADTWFNGAWWNTPFFGSSWFAATDNISLSIDSLAFTIDATDIAFASPVDDVILSLDSLAYTITATDILLSVPLEIDSLAFTIAATDIDFAIDYNTPTFIISNDSTFDGKGITYGIDIAYNSSTDRGYTIISRVDIDSILLDGAFGTAPQPYQLVKYVGEIEGKSVTTVEFDGDDWRIISSTRLGL